MIKKDNYEISKKIHNHLSCTTTIAALFSVILILSAGGIGLPLLQKQQQEAYASLQAQAPPPTQTTPSSQVPPIPPAPTRICDPKSPTTLQLGSTGASPPSPSSFREIIGSLTSQLAAAGDRIGAVYDQFGMFI
jgi:hypothetical protein